MRTMSFLALMAALVAISSGRTEDKSWPNDRPQAVPNDRPQVVPNDRPQVVVNTQKSLLECVGKGFDEAWEYPAKLLPAEFPGLKYVSGPGDRDLFPKGAWRKPVVLKHGESGTNVFVNCYRKRVEAAAASNIKVVTPFVSLTEPNYQYKPVKFHDCKAAVAEEDASNVFVFRQDDILFKVEAAGGKAEERLALVRASAEAIWKWRQPK